MSVSCKEEFHEDIPFRTTYLKVSNSLHTVLLWVCMLMTSYCKTKLFLRALTDLLISVCKNPPTVALAGLWLIDLLQVGRQQRIGNVLIFNLNLF